VDSSKKKEGWQFEPSFNRVAHKPAYPLLVPPAIDKQGGPHVTEDRRFAEPARANSVDDKICALKQYRRARGLCDRCAEKLSYGHQCSSTVQLHVIQEFWDMFQEDESLIEKQDSREHSDNASQLCLCLFEAATSGVDYPRSMRLIGSIQGHPMLILVDFGSSNSPVKGKLAGMLTGATPLSQLLYVAVVNGAKMSCGFQLEQVLWELQGYRFHSDLKVLPPHHYDMVLGYDWLAQFSPMKIHWATKWMAVPFGSSTIVIQGILFEMPVGSML
jgi:hypothetical protein